MKTILFCNLPYAFSILKPLAEVLEKNEENYLWYVSSSIVNNFPLLDGPVTSRIEDLEAFGSDVIFVCGNDVPYWLRGLKVQVFHGLAGEKKGHFRIRDYFDLYLTQGPYFTQRFAQLAKKHQDFDVRETGWCKLDKLYTISEQTKDKKKALLEKYSAHKIILYAPTFSPSLSSALEMHKIIEKLGEHEGLLVLIKFHDKMQEEWIALYKKSASDKVVIVQADDITQSLQIADIMISDSSSVVYEFTLLDKPVVTLNSISENIDWCNVKRAEEVYEQVLELIEGNDIYRENRQGTIALYHPYNDGKSAQRMIEACANHIKVQGVPSKRKLSLLRKYKMLKKYKRK